MQEITRERSIQLSPQSRLKFLKTSPSIESVRTKMGSRNVKKMSNLLEFKTMNRLLKISMLTASSFFIGVGVASADGHVYADFPITLKGYEGNATTSVSYGGQMARHMLHNGLKKAAASGDLGKMEMYFNGAESVPILDPKSSDKFPIKQTKVEELSKGKTLVKKTYKGKVIG